MSFTGRAVVIGDGAWGSWASAARGRARCWRASRKRDATLTDDVLVVSGMSALAGPRCVDLREEAVRLLGLADRTQLVRAGQRLRLGLGPVAPEVPFRGWLALSWGPQTRLDPLSPTERLQGLASNLVGLQQTRFRTWGARRHGDSSRTAGVELIPADS